VRTVAHISDLHFGRTDPAIVVGLLADLRAERPDFIVVSGDLTQRAYPSQFREAAAFLKLLPAPYLVIPGNHDIPGHDLLGRFTRPLAGYRRYISNDLTPLYRDDEIAVLGLNTARAVTYKHMDWEEGRISYWQIEHVRRVFGGMIEPNLFKILVTHHPFLPPPDSPDTRLVDRAPKAMPTFEECGVDLLLAGHLHRIYSGDASTHYAASKRSILVAQASTATSTRTRNEPNAYNVIIISEGRCGIRVKAWDGAQFQGQEAIWFVRDGQRWRRTTPEPKPVEPAAATSDQRTEASP
jgi:3',5'-cyclic AMP phosphodiesterase CpdA